MRPFKQLGKDVEDIYTTFATILLTTPLIIMLVYLAFMTLTSCKGWEVRFQGDLNEERWEARQQER
jgi:hypothetical protein|tara:strand:+ start:440 stop:637 length:198 start_codon:yes stop_codon:yes gene_type:complete